MGDATRSDGTTGACLYTGDAMLDIGGFSPQVFNDLSTVVGSNGSEDDVTHAVVWKEGALTEPFSDWTTSNASHGNNAVDVLGQGEAAELSPGERHRCDSCPTRSIWAGAATMPR